MIGMTIESTTGFFPPPVVFLPPIAAMSFSDSMPMPSRSAFLAATAGKAATTSANAMRAGVSGPRRSAEGRVVEVDMAGFESELESVCPCATRVPNAPFLDPAFKG